MKKVPNELKWIADDLRMALRYIQAHPEQCRGGEEYVRGLTDMLKWTVEKIESDTEYHLLREFVDGFIDLPANPRSLQVKNERRKKAKANVNR